MSDPHPSQPPSEEWDDPLIREFPDRSIRVLLERPPLLVALIEILDPAQAGRIDPGSMKRLDRTFIDERYRKRESDLLYRASFRPQAGGAVWVYCLLEHQSSLDPWIPFRLLLAMTRIWEEERRTGAEALSPILPILLYVGDQPWPPPVRLAGLVNAPAELARFVPAFDIPVLDLKCGDPGPLQTSDHPFAAVLLALREEGAAQAPFAAALARAAERVNDLGELEEQERLALIRYLCALVFQRRPRQETAGLFKALRDKLDTRKQQEVDEMITLAQQLREEGKQEGKQEVLLRLLAAKFGPLSEGVVQAVRRTCDSQTLDAWSERVLTAQRLTEVGIGE